MKHLLLILLTLCLALPASISAKQSPYFHDDSEMDDFVAHATKPLYIEDATPFAAGETIHQFHGDQDYGDITIKHLRTRRALVGDSCTVNKLITEVGLGNWSEGLGNITDENLDNYAGLQKVVGVGATVDPIISVRDMANYYAAGTKAGYCIVASSGNAVLSLDVVKAMSIGFYRDGELQGVKVVNEGQSGSGITLSLIQIPGSEDACVMLTAKSDWVFDEVSLDRAGGVAVSVGDLLKIKYAFVGDNNEYPITADKRTGAGGLADWTRDHPKNPVVLDYVKGWNPVLLGLPFPMVQKELDRFTDTDLDNYASLTPLVAVGYQGGMKFMTKNPDTAKANQETFAPGTEVGFKYKFGSGLGLDAGSWMRLILFDRNGNKVQEETIKAEVLNLSVAKGGDGTAALTASVPFSGAELRLHTVLGVNLGAICMHYAFVKEKPEASHHCPISPQATSNVCDNVHELDLLSNPAVPVRWAIALDENGDPMRPAQATALDVTPDGHVTNMRVQGDYTFVATTLSGCCTDTTVVHYNMFGEQAAIRPDGTVNPDGCALPMVNQLGVGKFVPSNEVYDSSGSLISVSDITGKENIVSDDFNTYAEYTSGLNVASNMSIIGVKRTDAPIYDSANDEPKRIGFIIENDVTGLDLSALQFLQIRCYKNGRETYRHVISENNAVSAGIAGSDDMQKIRYSIELPTLDGNGNYFSLDEFQLWTSGVLNLGGSKMRIYYAFIENAVSGCASPLGCGSEMISYKNHATLNGDATQYGDAISVARTVNDICNLLDGNPNTAMTIANPVNAGGMTIAVKLGRTADSRHQLGIIVDNKTYVANITVGSWLKAYTYYNGQPTGDTYTDWSAVGANVAGYGDKNFLFITPNSPYDEVRLELGGVVSALDIQSFYGLFLRGEADHDGSPDCQDIESCPLKARQQPVCAGQDVVFDFDDEYQLKPNYEYTVVVSEPGANPKQYKATTDASGWLTHRHTAATVGREHTITLYDGTQAAATATYSVRPDVTEWKRDAQSTDWNLWDNWTNGTPYCCSNVVVPSDAVRYPVLTPSNNAFEYCCDNIHIAPRGVVAGTPHLNYKRAFIDVEAPANQYRLFAAPLKDMYTGDMFLPDTAGVANPHNPRNYFMQITQANTPAPQRFNPSIYQRLWDTTNASADVTLSGSALQHQSVSAAQTEWTHYFNSVSHLYQMWKPISLWVDPGTRKEDTFTFRFPKAHTAYTYYSDYDPAVSFGSETINRTAQADDYNGTADLAPHRFIYEEADQNHPTTKGDYLYNTGVVADPSKPANKDTRRVYDKKLSWDISLTTNGSDAAGEYLLGNPFISRIYLEPFLAANTNVAAVRLEQRDAAPATTPRTITVQRGQVATADVNYIAPMEAAYLIPTAEYAAQHPTALALTVSTDMMSLPEPAAAPARPVLRVAARIAAQGEQADDRTTRPATAGARAVAGDVPPSAHAGALTPSARPLLEKDISIATCARGEGATCPARGEGATPPARGEVATSPATPPAAIALVDAPDATTVATLFDAEVPTDFTLFAIGPDGRACDIAPAADITPLAIVAPDTATVVLSFSTAALFPRDNYYVLDRQTDQHYTLDDDIVLPNAGTTFARYAIVRGDAYAPTAIETTAADPAAHMFVSLTAGMITVRSTAAPVTALTITAPDGQSRTVHAATAPALPALNIITAHFADGTQHTIKLYNRQ